MDYTSYIRPELLCFVPALNILGWLIKNHSGINNSLIPLILGLSGIFLCTLYVASERGFSPEAIASGIVQGILVASSGVYLNQLYKQAKKEDEDGEDND